MIVGSYHSKSDIPKHAERCDFNSVSLPIDIKDYVFQHCTPMNSYDMPVAMDRSCRRAQQAAHRDSESIVSGYRRSAKKSMVDFFQPDFVHWCFFETSRLSCRQCESSISSDQAINRFGKSGAATGWFTTGAR
jgi:hypothetical protein